MSRCSRLALNRPHTPSVYADYEFLCTANSWQNHSVPCLEHFHATHEVHRVKPLTFCPGFSPCLRKWEEAMYSAIRHVSKSKRTSCSATVKKNYTRIWQRRLANRKLSTNRINNEFYIRGSVYRESNLITDDGCQHPKHVELPTEI